MQQYFPSIQSHCELSQMIGDEGKRAFILALLLICLAVAAIKQHGGNVNHGVSHIYTMIQGAQRLCQGVVYSARG